ncbi:MAG: hypothetical protein WDW38_002567 [Sanguina aurantia]
MLRQGERSRAGLLVQASNKDTPATPKAPASAASSQADRNIELLEERLRGGRVRKGKVEAKVKVTSPLVDAVSGRTPATPQTEAETTYITFLFGFFVLIITEGLTLAASGFMPEEIDAFVQDYLYPSYSPTVLAFLGASSLYGLWKTGKLPGMTQG